MLGRSRVWLKPVGRSWLKPQLSGSISQPIHAHTFSSTCIYKNKASPAKFLVGLNEPQSIEEADKEAREWLETLQQVRAEFTAGGEGSYRPSREFASEGVAEIDLVQQILDHQAAQKFEPSEAQRLEAEHLKQQPLPPKSDDTLNFLTNLVMKDGKKARAEKYMSRALYLVHLKTRKDPLALLKQILDDMAPLVKLKRYTDGGARAELVPTPLSQRQRQRQAWVWILEAAEKRPSKDFSVRLATEILAAVEGKSPGYEKRVQQHKLAVVNRAFVKMLTKTK